MFVADHHTTEQLQELTRALPQKRIWRRAQAVLLAKQGRTAQDIADALGCSLKAVKNWVAQYNVGGIEARQDHRSRQRQSGDGQEDADDGRAAGPRNNRCQINFSEKNELTPIILCD